VTEDVRILKIQHDRHATHVREPGQGPVRQVGPESDKAETDLHGSADGSRAHYQAWNHRADRCLSREGEGGVNDLRIKRRYSGIKHELNGTVIPRALFSFVFVHFLTSVIIDQSQLHD